MNYYKHHLGDYSKDTAGLTMLEHGAYRLLIDAYYASEAPIPADEVYAIAKAGSAIERKAVDKVLRKFFTQDGESWRQKRVEEELAHYQEVAEKNREVGKLGGRPRNPNKTQTDTQTKPKRLSNDNPDETLASNHKPITNKKHRGADALTVEDLISDGLTEQTASEFLALRRSKGAKLTARAWDGVKAEAQKAGWTTERAVCKALARGWQSFEAAWVSEDRGSAPAAQPWDGAK